MAATESRPGELRVNALLARRGPAAAIVLTDEQVAHLSAAKVFPVVVTIGEKNARLRVARMGGENLIGLSKSVRADLGVDAGDTVEVVITHDSGPREIAVPEALSAALDADPRVRAAFEALAPSRRKELARSVAEAKRDNTRQRRVVAIVDSLR